MEAPYIIHHQRAPELSRKAKLPVTSTKGVPFRSRLRALVNSPEDGHISSCLNVRLGKCRRAICPLDLLASFAGPISTFSF